MYAVFVCWCAHVAVCQHVCASTVRTCGHLQCVPVGIYSAYLWASTVCTCGHLQCVPVGIYSVYLCASTVRTCVFSIQFNLADGMHSRSNSPHQMNCDFSFPTSTELVLHHVHTATCHGRSRKFLFFLDVL